MQIQMHARPFTSSNTQLAAQGQPSDAHQHSSAAPQSSTATDPPSSHSSPDAASPPSTPSPTGTSTVVSSRVARASEPDQYAKPGSLGVRRSSGQRLRQFRREVKQLWKEYKQSAREKLSNPWKATKKAMADRPPLVAVYWKMAQQRAKKLTTFGVDQQSELPPRKVLSFSPSTDLSRWILLNDNPFGGSSTCGLELRETIVGMDPTTKRPIKKYTIVFKGELKPLKPFATSGSNWFQDKAKMVAEKRYKQYQQKQQKQKQQQNEENEENTTTTTDDTPSSSQLSSKPPPVDNIPTTQSSLPSQPPPLSSTPPPLSSTPPSPHDTPMDSTHDQPSSTLQPDTCPNPYWKEETNTTPSSSSNAAEKFRQENQEMLAKSNDANNPTASPSQRSQPSNMIQGFAACISSRYEWPDLDLSEYDFLSMQVRTDGRPYIFNVRCRDSISSSRGFIYQARIKEETPRPMHKLEIRLENFICTYNGRMKSYASPMPTDRIESFGFSLTGPAGPFELELESITAHQGVPEFELRDRYKALASEESAITKEIRTRIKEAEKRRTLADELHKLRAAKAAGLSPAAYEEKLAEEKRRQAEEEEEKEMTTFELLRQRMHASSTSSSSSGDTAARPAEDRSGWPMEYQQAAAEKDAEEQRVREQREQEERLSRYEEEKAKKEQFRQQELEREQTGSIPTPASPFPPSRFHSSILSQAEIRAIEEEVLDEMYDEKRREDTQLGDKKVKF